MIKIQYASDIHLEFIKSIEQIPKILKNINADVLVLAGDISAISSKEDYDKFIMLLAYYCPKYKYVIHISGNHEYYVTHTPVTKDDCMNTIHRKFKTMNKQFPNYLYLNCEAVTLQINGNPYCFIGATLWSKVKQENYAEIQSSMNDYLNIYINRSDKVVKFTIEVMQQLHNKHRLFIKKAIERSDNLKIPAILITHHKSVGDTPTDKQTKFTQAYETDITNLLKPIVKLCIWGHTHVHYNKEINGIKFVSNPLGYPRQRTGFKSDCFITI